MLLNVNPKNIYLKALTFYIGCIKVCFQELLGSFFSSDFTEFYVKQNFIELSTSSTLTYSIRFFVVALLEYD